jgi:DNA-binding NarL/FixJ family response regulator
MNEKKSMPLLLIEDDVAECRRFKDCAAKRTDMTFVGMTASSEEGLLYVQTRMPEGIILDLELHRGKGSGLQFLSDLKAINMAVRPLIIVTTNSPSSVVYNHVHNFGADLVFYKRQEGYSPDMVLSTMSALRKSLQTVRKDDLPQDMQTIESPDERRARVLARIDAELDLVGINVRYKGRMYLQEAVYLLLSRENKTSEAILYKVADNHKHSYSSVIRAIQTVINRAWDTSGIDDLQRYYTARVNVHTGVPSPTEFIHYYVDKIRKTM